MNDFERAKNFDNAIFNLSENVRKRLEYINTSQKARIQEVRLLAGCPLQITDSGGTRFVRQDSKISELPCPDCYEVTKADIEESFRIICGYSVHTHQNEIVNGYITLKGGHRAGICGTAVMDGERVTGIKDISSINLRIAGQLTGVTGRILPSWVLDSDRSLIIAGPPCSGKTTLLRDAARTLSSMGKRVSVIDERGEIAAVYHGKAQNDLGACCDVLNAYPKAFGIMTALRCMSPQVIICDEVGGWEEARQIKSGLNCGVRFVITAHCSGPESLMRRPQIKELLDSGEFEYIALLQGGRFIGSPAKIITVGKKNDEGNRTSADNSAVYGSGGVAV